MHEAVDISEMEIKEPRPLHPIWAECQEVAHMWERRKEAGQG